MKITTESELFKRMFKAMVGYDYIDIDRSQFIDDIDNALAAAEECLNLMEEVNKNAFKFLQIDINEYDMKICFDDYLKSKNYIQ